MQNLRALELRPQTPVPSDVGGVAPKPPMASCGRIGSYLINNLLFVVFSVYPLYSAVAYPGAGGGGGGGEGSYSPLIGLSTKMQNKENITFLAFLILFFFVLEWTKK